MKFKNKFIKKYNNFRPSSFSTLFTKNLLILVFIYLFPLDLMVLLLGGRAQSNKHPRSTRKKQVRVGLGDWDANPHR